MTNILLSTWTEEKRDEILIDGGQPGLMKFPAIYIHLTHDLFKVFVLGHLLLNIIGASPCDRQI